MTEHCSYSSSRESATASLNHCLIVFVSVDQMSCTLQFKYNKKHMCDIGIQGRLTVRVWRTTSICLSLNSIVAMVICDMCATRKSSMNRKQAVGLLPVCRLNFAPLLVDTSSLLFVVNSHFHIYTVRIIKRVRTKEREREGERERTPNKISLVRRKGRKSNLLLTKENVKATQFYIRGWKMDTLWLKKMSEAKNSDYLTMISIFFP